MRLLHICDLFGVAHAGHALMHPAHMDIHATMIARTVICLVFGDGAGILGSAVPGPGVWSWGGVGGVGERLCWLSESAAIAIEVLLHSLAFKACIARCNIICAFSSRFALQVRDQLCEDADIDLQDGSSSMQHFRCNSNGTQPRLSFVSPN